jgi:hypothetical protein
MCGYGRGSDWWMGLMITCTLSTRHHTLQVTDTHILVCPLFQSPLAVSWQRIFNTGTITVSLNLSLIKFYVHRCTLTPNTFFHRLPYRSKLSTDNCVGCLTCFHDNFLEWTTQKSQPLYWPVSDQLIHSPIQIPSIVTSWQYGGSSFSTLTD